MPASRSTVYSANAWTFNFGGLAIETGKGKDEFLKITQKEDTFSYQQGIDGEGVFSWTGATSVEVELTLLQTSAGNAVLSAIHNASLLLGGSPSPLFIEDRNGTSKTASVAALIKKWPDDGAASEAGMTKWEFIVHDPVRFVGSH
jgi:hypothetical protein